MSNEDEWKLYSCGYNGFGQLPLMDQQFEKYQAVFSPELCIFCPPRDKQLTHCLAVSWSSCFLNKGIEIVQHGFSCGQTKRNVTIKNDSSIKSIHSFRGSLFVTTSRNILLQRSATKLEPVKFDEKDEISIEVDYLDSDANNLFVLSGKDAGKLEQSGDSFIYKTVFTNDSVNILTCGKEHVLLLTKSGVVFSFGAGSRGQLGHGIVQDKLQTPTQIDALAAVPMKGISAGGWHSLAVSEYGDLYIWGWNESGQLGFAKQTERDKSKKRRCSTTLDEARKESIAVDSLEYQGDVSTDKTQNYMEEASLAVTFLMSPQILDMSPPKEILIKSASCGARHTAAVTTDGHLYTWGSGRWGQLGHGNEWTRDNPTRVESLYSKECIVLEVYCREWNTFFVVEETIS